MSGAARLAVACVIILASAAELHAQKVQPNREPRVNLVQPRPNDQFISPATILLRAQARDRDYNLARVEFYANGTLIGTSTAEPYRFNWGPVGAGEYVVLAKAVDAMGATDDSRTVTIRVTGNHAPTVSVASPASGTIFSAPGPISVTANATDTDGDLTRVDFYAGDSLIGTALTPPYVITWANNASGAYALTAQVTDSQGLFARSAPVLVTVNAPPTVTLTSPGSGTVVHAGDSVTLNADVADTDGTISKVDFYRDGTMVGTDTTSPYSLALPNLSAGTASFTAVATDDRGGTTASAAVTFFVNAGPTVALGSPPSGTIVQAPGSILLRADAGDIDGKVTKVDFYQGSTLLGTATTDPYIFTLTNLASGIYNFTATASDDRGAVTTSSGIAVIVNAAPTAGLTNPAQGAVFTAPANIPISAEVADGDGTISRVEFYVGTARIATRTAPPYSIVWTGVPQGNYSLSVRAIDNNGGNASSAAANITVNQGVAKLYFVHVDHLNTPRLVADDQQRTVWKWDQQEPFGNNAPDENPSGLGTFEFSIRFPGQYFDKETNLHYNYFRDYHPGLGRYVESDPIGLRGGLNTYAYVAGDPLSGFDPFGLEVRFMCRYLSGGARITNYQHCFVHVTCPEEAWIKTFSLFRDDVVGSLGYKAEDDPRDNPAGPSAPITFNQPVTPSQSCAAPCAFEKAVVAKYRSFPSGPVPYRLFGPNSNSFARSLVTTTPFAAQLPPASPSPQYAPGIAQQMPGFPR